jgi:site-specific DNA recombinase
MSRLERHRKRVVLYARASRDDTGEGRSVERQLEAARKLCELRDWLVVAELVDNSISAWSGKARPAWKQVLDLIEDREVDVVVAWHIDRMTRSIIDLEQLILLAEDSGVGIATVSGDIDLTSDVGRMVARILAAVARAEVERKAARQRLANAQRAAEGVPASGGVRPFGYADDRITVVPEEAEAIRRGAQQALAGIPLAVIAEEWAGAGLVSSRSDKAKAGWTARGVKNVLTNPRTAGRRMYLGEDVGAAAWAPILDTETHLALVAKLTDPGRVLGTVKMGKTPTTLLTSIATCGVCQAHVRASSVRGAPTYACRHSHSHPPRAEADAWVHARMITLLSSPDALSELAPSDSDGVETARKERDEADQRLGDLADAYATGEITRAQLARATARLQQRLDELEALLAHAVGPDLLAGMRVGTDQVTRQWEELPLARQRALVDRLLTIEVHPVGRTTFDPAVHMSVKRRGQ